MYPIIKTIIKKKIPFKIKLKAIFAAIRIIKNKEADSNKLISVISSFCKWDQTKEGYDFWHKIFKAK